MSKARDLANAADVLDDVSATELGYVNGVTSAIQTQLDNKQAVVSGVDNTEIGYLNGVTSAIQTQIDSKIGQANAINPTIVDAKGDIIAATAADTVARLAVGSNDQVLTADSSTATGLKWATPSAGGMTLISTTTLTGAQVTLSSIPQTYNNLRLVIRNYRPASDQTLYATFNNVTSGYRVIESTSYFAGADTGSGDTYLKLLYDQNTDNSANSNIIIVDIDDYANTATFKLGRSQFYKEGINGTDYNQGFFPFASYSTSAISSIELLNTGAANFTSGTVLLYGVK